MNLKFLQNTWKDTPEYHKTIAELFTDSVNENSDLSFHRTWVESHAHGFGERPFWYLWKLILDGLPSHPALLEVGVYMGATLSAWKLLRPDAFVFGITPLDSSDGHLDVDYSARIKQIHDEFKQPEPILLVGRSDSGSVVSKASNVLYDVIYLDGGHTREVVDFDLSIYPKMVKKCGYLVIDDANCNMNMPFGFFQGIQSVTDAKLAWLATNPPFEFVCSVVHISVFKRI